MTDTGWAGSGSQLSPDSREMEAEEDGYRVKDEVAW